MTLKIIEAPPRPSLRYPRVDELPGGTVFEWNGGKYLKVDGHPFDLPWTLPTSTADVGDAIEYAVRLDDGKLWYFETYTLVTPRDSVLFLVLPGETAKVESHPTGLAVGTA